MSNWKSASQAFGEPTAEDLTIRDYVLDLAAQHAAKSIDHWEVRRQCSGRDRFDALRCTPTDHPSRLALLAMIDDLIAQDPTQQYGWTYSTRQGDFSLREIEAVQGTVSPDGDRLLIRFPIRYGKFGAEFKAPAA